MRKSPPKRKSPAKKHLSQNFLVDNKIRDRIIHACNLSHHDIVLEIGPGKGALTRDIARSVKKFYAVEKDKELATHLTNTLGSTTKIFPEDILSFDFHKLNGPLKVVGNLPYHISTPLIEKFIENRKCFSSLYLTLQREFAQRLAAEPNNKNYGSLSCFIQYYADVSLLFHIPAKAFRPAPKITSSFLKIVFRKPSHHANNEMLLFRFIRQAFQARRKKLVNARLPYVDKGHLQTLLNQCGIAENARAENLSLTDYINLVNRII